MNQNQFIVGVISGFVVATTMYMVGALMFMRKIKELKAKIASLSKQLAANKRVFNTNEYYLIQSGWGYYALSPDVDSCYWVQDSYKAIRFTDPFDLNMFIRSTQYRGGNMPIEIVKYNMFTI